MCINWVFGNSYVLLVSKAFLAQVLAGSWWAVTWASLVTLTILDMFDSESETDVPSDSSDEELVEV